MSDLIAFHPNESNFLFQFSKMAQSVFLENTLDSSIKALSQIANNIVKETKERLLDHERLKGIINNVEKKIGCFSQGAT